MNNQFNLIAVKVTSAQHFACVVETWQSTESCKVTVSIDETVIASGEGYDFEEALQFLRSALESQGLHLLCNRYRRNAFVTSMSRQMSEGLGCYLVRPRRPVGTDPLADCLGAADESHVCSKELADVYIARWRARPPLYIYPMIAWEILWERFRA